ncbi:MAG TPA: major facilitator superfamily domain-containing protein 6, partial [Anaerolineae bacterium]
MIRPKAFYFLYFAAAASLIPFLSLYYRSLGLMGRQIGVLTGVVPLVTMVSAPLWGGLADASQRHRPSLLLAIVGTWTAVLGLSQPATFDELLLLVVIYAFFTAPIIPLTDNSVLVLLGGRKAEYGKLRLWGGVGWAVAATLLGPVLQRAGLSWAFYSFLLFLFVAFVVAWRMPVLSTTAHQAYRAGLRILLTSPRFLLLLAVALVYGASLSVFLKYLFLYLETLNASRTLMALSLVTATISELPLWVVTHRLIQRWGTSRMLAIALVAMCIRAFAYALISAPWLVLPINLLHGLSFALLWAGGVAAADAIAPPGLGATAQGIFAGVVMGLGAGVGGFAGGVLYDSIGPVALFQAT